MKSNLQIISGKYRGKKLFLPKLARPTQNMARGAVFNMLNNVLSTKSNLRIWDVFAGAGSLGIECLSRFDNCFVLFTDIEKDSINTIQKNLVKIDGNYRVENVDAISVIKKYAHNTDLFFIDPPYVDFKLGTLFVRKIAAVTNPKSIVVWEFEQINEPKIDEKDWGILCDKTYGRARFLILQKK